MFKGHSFDNGHFLYCFTFGCSIAVVSCSSKRPELVLTLSLTPLWSSGSTIGCRISVAHGQSSWWDTDFLLLFKKQAVIWSINRILLIPVFPTDFLQLLLLFSSCRAKKTTRNSKTKQGIKRIKSRWRRRVQKQSNSFWESFMLTRHSWRSCSKMKVFLFPSRFYFSFISFLFFFIYFPFWYPCDSSLYQSSHSTWSSQWWGVAGSAHGAVTSLWVCCKCS